MPEEIEVPTEHLHEQIHHEAHQGAKWIIGVALSSALLAVFASVSAMIAGDHANEAMIAQIHAADQWAYYQAKGIKAAVLESKLELLGGLGKEVSEKDRAKLSDYRKEQQQIKEDAGDMEKESAHDLKVHTTLAKSVTMFQIAIALGAISALTRKKLLWFVSLALGAAGIVLFGLGMA